MTPNDLALAAGIAPDLAFRWYPHINEMADRFQVTGKRLAMWIAQCGHESDSFTRLVENLNYSAPGLHRVWPKRFPTVADAVPYMRQPEKIANKVYANRMGNGDEGSGDGWRFRGRGLIQLTGRANYKACGGGLGVDLVGDPGLLSDPRWASLSAGWFWQTRKLNALSDAGDVEAVTRKINGGTTGLQDRLVRYDRALPHIGV